MIKEEVSNKSKHAFVVIEIVNSMGKRNSCIAHTCRNCNNASHFMTNFDRLQC